MGQPVHGGEAQEWASRLVPHYERGLPEVKETVLATYLASANT